MDSILVQSILLACVAMFANFDFITGGTMISRPLVTSLLTGIVMGDMKMGIIIGATLELAFMGAFSIGAVIPPDTISGAILGTAFAISAGEGAEVALTLALPIATLVLLIKNLVHVFILPFFVNLADKFAEQGNGRGISIVNIIGGFVYVTLSIVIVVGVGFYFGSEVVTSLLAKIPDFILAGLGIATGILPAFGLALLAQPILSKFSVVFFIVGFAMAGYFQLSITALAIFGFALALMLTGYTNPLEMNKSQNSNYDEGTGYEDEEF